MNSWIKLLKKYDHRPSASTLVICRGKSAEYVDTLIGRSAAGFVEQIILVNDWHNEFPECIRTNKGKVLNFLSVMRDRRPQKIYHSSAATEELKHVRTHEPGLKHLNGEPIGPTAMNDDLREKIMILGIQREFDDIWNTGDTGIMAVAYASILDRSVIITGLDFWEASYWTSPAPRPQQTSTEISKRKFPIADQISKRKGLHKYDETKRKKGQGKKDKLVKLLIDLMRAHTSCMFFIHTLSPTFKAALEEVSESVDHVNLI